MKISFVASYLILTLLTGCETGAAAGFHKEREAGYLRCGPLVDDEGNKVMDPDREVDGVEVQDDFRCPLIYTDGRQAGQRLPDDELVVCCTAGVWAHAECILNDACQERQNSTNGVVWRSQCDDSADCAILFPGDPKKAICCGSFKKGNRYSLCMAKCPIIDKDQNQVCLSTWECASGQQCLANPFFPPIYMCQVPDKEG